MCISAFHSLPIGCVLFHLQIGKHGRRYTWPGCWAEHLARLSLLSMQYLCTDFAAHRLSGLTAISQRRAYLKPIQTYLSCKKNGERHRLLRKWSPCEKSNPASHEGSEPPGHQKALLSCTRGEDRTELGSNRLMNGGKCMIPDVWGTDWSLHPKVKPNSLWNIFHFQNTSHWEKKKITLGSFLCLSVFGFWAKMTNCFWVSFAAF